MRRHVVGFTLIELVVAMAVIATLAALLFPVITSAKEGARRATCLSNLKQLGKGIGLYADEWGGRFPIARLENGGYGKPQGNWAGVYDVRGKCDPRLGQIFPYIRNADVYLCPTDRGVRPARVTAPEALPYPLSYSMNNIMDSCTAADIRSYSKVGLLVHEDRDCINDGDFYWLGWKDGWEGGDKPGKMHRGGTCILFCDLHAEWQRYETVIQALRSGAWDPLNIERD